MYDQKQQEIIDLYRILGIEGVDNVKDTLCLGEIDGRKFSKSENKENVINYSANANK